MKDTVIFHLAKHIPPLNPAWALSHELPEPKTLYEQIKDGSKTSEWRDFSKYWTYRLCHSIRLDHTPQALVFNVIVNGTEPQDLTSFLKLHRAWFVQGYPTANLQGDRANLS